jgi:hypothetical protein
VTTFLLPVADVHATAAACDYLAGRLVADDAVHVLPLPSGPGPGTGPGAGAAGDRDAEDAVNAARSRLLATAATVEVHRAVEAAGPDEALRDAVAAVGADEVVLGDRRDGATEPGDDPAATLLALVRASAVPVRVVPAPP